MCGFFFTTNVNYIKFNLVNEYLSVRGRDQFNEIFFGDNYYAHSRLQISGSLNTGIQPKVSSEFQMSLLFNGEIYSFGNFENELEKNFSSDTDKLWYLVNNYELDEISKNLDGMYAIGVGYYFKDRLIKVSLLRDKYGQKPLFFHTCGKDLIFSSSSLLIAKNINKVNFKKDSLSSFFTLGFTLGSIYEGINEVKRNQIIHFMKDDHSGWIVKKKEIKNKNYLHVKELSLEEIIYKSIEECIPHNNDYAISLSGGIDSTSIASIISRKNFNKPLKAYCYATSDEEINKSSNTANYLGLDHEIVKAPTCLDEIKEIYKICLKGCDVPISDSGLIPNYLLTKEISKDKIKVLLSGDGGDELFLGYNRHVLLDILFSTKVRKFFLKNIVNNIPINLLSILVKYSNYGSTNYITRVNQLKQLMKINNRNNILFYSLINPYLINQNQLRINDIVSEFKESEFAHIRDFEFDFYLCYNNLVRSDRISYINDIEIRAPLLTNQLDESLLNEKPNNKKFLRNLIQKQIPNFRPVRKTGFSHLNSIKALDEIKALIPDDFVKLIQEKTGLEFKDCSNNDKLLRVYIWLNENSIDLS